MRRRKTLAAGAALAMLGGLVAPAAEAGRPDRFELPPLETFVDPSCPESIAPQGVEWSSAGGNFAALFFDDGRELKVGRHPDLVTNVSNGKSVLLELQGSMRSSQVGDEYRLSMSGTNGFLFYPGDAGPGDIDEPRVYVFTGEVRIRIDSSFVVTKFTHTGRARDICAELAG